MLAISYFSLDSPTPKQIVWNLEMRTQIRKIGNSLGNIIPAGVVRQMGLSEGAYIDVQIDGQRIIIEPVKTTQKRFPFTEQELLIGLNSDTGHADALATVSQTELSD